MPNHQLLNNVTHQDLKIITEHSAEYGDNVGTVMTFPTEFADVQKEYPIFFRKHPNSEEFQSVVMLGLFQNDNLFLDGNNWKANYIPAAIARGPFAIGFQDQSADGGPERAPVVHIDMDHPRVNTTHGHPVFLEHGGNSPYLEHISNMFTHLMDGLDIEKAMFAAFKEFDLLEPIELEVTLPGNQIHKLHGNYTVSQTKLQALSPENLHALHRAGFLEGAYLVRSSLSNIQKLVNWQNQKMQQQNQSS
ncbi:SapC family protein [Paraglaciecola aquimarina]|uniref:SapC family protein n=1 Tax=Paraglaciecola aquimarina TaxID=1235557 RepID=A0ABU3SZQ3_9ALTE|nr:SapC family protein [Paraglaciecola aquimarina]MDU0355496.1 SapC family protein [Paraglaciecola aquimarina]